MILLLEKIIYFRTAGKPSLGGLFKSLSRTWYGMFRCKARKNWTARRILSYVEQCGLQRNPDFIGTDRCFV